MESSDSTIPASGPGTIRHETTACILALEQCLSVEPLIEEHWAENRLTDMKLWASSVGALAHPRSSFDQRLEFLPEDRVSLITHLRTLRELINTCRLVALAQAPGQEADDNLRSELASAPAIDDAFKPTTGSGSDGGFYFTVASATTDSDSDTDSTISIDSDAPDIPAEDRPRVVLQELMKTTRELLKTFMEFGLDIRRTGNLSSLWMADDSFNPDHLETIGKLLRQLPSGTSRDSLTVTIEQQWATLLPNATQPPTIAYIDQVKDLHVFREHLEFILRHDVRRWREQEKGDEDIAKNGENITSHGTMQEAKDDLSNLSAIQNHLILANLRRRHRFTYAKRNRQELGPEPLSQRELQVVAPATESGEDASPVPTRPSPRRSPPLLDGPLPINQSGTDPSTMGSITLERMLSTSRDTPTCVSVTAARLHYPSPPQNKERKWFRCPCCSQKLPEMFREKLRWRKHVSQDLLPYACPFEDCSMPEVLYGSREDWREHILASHAAGEYWQCLACAGTETPVACSTADELVVHATAEHKDELSEAHILALPKWGHKIIPPNISNCPLCPWPRGLAVRPSANASLEHVATCIHEFSLRALPWAEFPESRMPFPYERSTVAEHKALEWFEMIQEEMDDEDVEDISIEGIGIEIIPIQDVDISNIDIVSFHALPSLPQLEATENSYLPQDYFDEDSHASSQAERASCPSDILDAKESISGDSVPLGLSACTKLEKDGIVL
ncbi:hypothetical protein O1611_g565 [Lasiodiplodia mahajangana]|uniref:Uncharacterized protein n=1 Tax=Lasiodiplodia mahajangana TaxID=1108764 RepID=A0ACC2K0U3_9PEZI|nr:hypothetical protein O1611_g565 [Lasiodiplodia mahajangana]